jgi:hypothetical protein
MGFREHSPHPHVIAALLVRYSIIFKRKRALPSRGESRNREFTFPVYSLFDACSGSSEESTVSG